MDTKAISMRTTQKASTNMNMRKLEETDLTNTKFKTQFFELLDTIELTETFAISVFTLRRVMDAWTFVGLDEHEMPIATASLVLEQKFIGGGIVNGHIEDVNIHKNHQRKGIGTEIMEHVMEHAEKECCCDRVVLECKPHLEQFYKQFGFKMHSIAMKIKDVKHLRLTRDVKNSHETTKNAENQNPPKEPQGR